MLHFSPATVRKLARSNFSSFLGDVSTRGGFISGLNCPDIHRGGKTTLEKVEMMLAEEVKMPWSLSHGVAQHTGASIDCAWTEEWTE